MPRFNAITIRAVLGLVATFSADAAAQRITIPEQIARGAVSSVATSPSGQLPSVDDLLRRTDVIMMGTVGQPKSYLSGDQLDVYTDYPISNPVYIFQSRLISASKPGTVPSIAVTQLGGTIVFNGVPYTQKETALPPLTPGSRGLFLLQQMQDKYVIVGKYYGAFGIVDGKLKPLMAREDFAPDYRDITVENATARLLKAVHARGR